MEKSTLAKIALIGGAGLTAAGLFGRLMNYEMRRDEQLYVSPAALLDSGRPYEDFFYNHVPGSAWFFGAMYELFGEGGLLFSARFAMFLIWIVFAVAVAYFTWRLTRSTLIAFSAVVLLALNDFLLGVVGATATNNFLPLLFAYAGLCLFVLGLRGEGALRKSTARRGVEPVTIALAGASFSVALSIKVSAIAFIAPVAIAALLLPGTATFATRLRTVFLPFALGGLIGATPVLMVFIRAPELFLAHVIQYHTGPHVAYWSGPATSDEVVAIGLGAKALLAHGIWFSGVNLLIALGALIALVSYAQKHENGDARRSFGVPALAIAVAAIVAALGFAPTPSFPQYFAPLPVALLFLIAVLLPPETTDRHRPLEVAFLAIAALSMIVGAPRIAQHGASLVLPASWTVSKVHQAGEEIAAEMAKAGVDGKVLTLIPIYPLEAGLEIYPEFATGQFAYRTGDLMSPELRKWYRTTAPSEITAFLEADPPAAMLLGFEPVLESPMAEFAQSQGYRRVAGFEVDDRYGNGYLMLRPDRP